MTLASRQLEVYIEQQEDRADGTLAYKLISTDANGAVTYQVDGGLPTGGRLDGNYIIFPANVGNGVYHLRIKATDSSSSADVIRSIYVFRRREG